MCCVVFKYCVRPIIVTVQCGLRATGKSRKHDIGSLTALNGFCPRLLNAAEQAIQCCPSSARFRKRCDGWSQESKHHGDDANDDEQFEQRKSAGTLTLLQQRKAPNAFGATLRRGRTSEVRSRKTAADTAASTEDRKSTRLNSSHRT